MSSSYQTQSTICGMFNAPSNKRAVSALPHTRLILNFYNHLWQLPLAIAQSLNLAAPMLNQNWLTREDIDNMLRLAGFESIRSSQEVLWPLPLGGFADRYLVKLWPFREFALSNFVIARPAPQPAQAAKRLRCHCRAQRSREYQIHF